MCVGESEQQRGMSMRYHVSDYIALLAFSAVAVVLDVNANGHGEQFKQSWIVQQVHCGLYCNESNVTGETETERERQRQRERERQRRREREAETERGRGRDGEREAGTWLITTDKRNPETL